MSYQSAKNCFNENVALFANPQTNPEKYNLYDGLSNLTQAMENDLSAIKDLLEQILFELRRR